MEVAIPKAITKVAMATSKIVNPARRTLYGSELDPRLGKRFDRLNRPEFLVKVTMMGS